MEKTREVKLVIYAQVVTFSKEDFDRVQVFFGDKEAGLVLPSSVFDLEKGTAIEWVRRHFGVEPDVFHEESTRASFL